MANGYFVVHNGLTVGNANISSSGAISTSGSITSAGITAAAGNFTTLTASSATNSTSTSTGALVVTGGAGFGGNVFTGNVYTSGVFWSTNGAPMVSGINYSANTVAPTTPLKGDQWYNTSTDVLYEYVTDGSTSFWVDITSPTLSGVGGLTSIAANLTPAYNGNINITGNLIPTSNVTYDLGSPTAAFRSLYISGNTIHMGGAKITTDVTTGAFAMVPIPTLANPNPVATIFDGKGAISQYNTTAGALTAAQIASVVNANTNTGSSFANINVATTANIGRINVTSGIFWANGTAFSSGASSGGSGTSLPTNASGFLKNNGSGTLTWAPITDYSSATKIAIGSNAGTNQGSQAIAIGSSAGSNQSFDTVAIGPNAGQGQLQYAVAIGSGAGNSGQNVWGTAIGFYAGYMNQGTQAIAIGAAAGEMNQGDQAIAIGANAGTSNQSPHSIILNATGNTLDASASGLFVAPIRQDATPSNIIYYNPTTKEMTYGAAPSGGSSGAGAPSAASLFTSLTGMAAIQYSSQLAGFTGPSGTGRLMVLPTTYPYQLMMVASPAAQFMQKMGPYAGAPGGPVMMYPWITTQSVSSLHVDLFTDNYGGSTSQAQVLAFVLDSSTNPDTMDCYYAMSMGSAMGGALFVANGPQQSYGAYVSNPNYVYGMITIMGQAVDWTTFQPLPGIDFYYDAASGNAMFRAPGSVWSMSGAIGTLPGYNGSYFMQAWYFGN